MLELFTHVDNSNIMKTTTFRAEVLIAFFRRWLEEMAAAIQPTPPPHDIVAFNRLIYRENIPFVTGHPLHTKFQAEEPASSGAAIKHK